MSLRKTFKIGGIHPSKFKLTSNSPIIEAKIPEIVNIPIKQHIGAPAKILIKKADKVKVGTLIAEADGFISANIYSSVSGEVIKIDTFDAGIGYLETMISIKAEDDIWEETIDKTTDIVKEISLDALEIVEKIKKFGIVGLGGAGFPTSVKTTVPDGKKIDYLILNGIECEPFLTADDRLMIEKAEEIIIGAKIINKALGIQNAIIAIDENKPKAIEVLKKLTRSFVGVNVKVCKTKYPQGAEKQLIQAITGREVPSGKLPSDSGCLVQNVGTVFAIYEAIQKNKPLFERIVTISGDEAINAQNFRVRVGTPASALIKQAGGINDNVSQIVFGGPMMGKTIVNIDAPITKLTSGILLLSDEISKKQEEQDCIRCSKCVQVCPIGLRPYLITQYAKNDMFKEAKSINAMDCIECGSCSYACPAKIKLLDFCKLAKIQSKNI